MQELFQKIFDSRHLGQFTARELVACLRYLDDRYFNHGDSPLSDLEYEFIYRYFELQYPTHPYLAEVGSAVRKDAVNLPIPMPSLNQIHQGELQKKYLTKTSEDRFVITDKMDGVSAMLVVTPDGLKSAFSRGDAVEGSDITRHVKNITSLAKINTDCDIIIRGEIEIRNDVFDDMPNTIMSSNNTPYRNPRNMVSGVLNRKTAPEEVYECLDFIAYEVMWADGITFNTKESELEFLESLGFDVPFWSILERKGMNEDILNEIVVDRKSKCLYDIDGIVVYNNTVEIKNNEQRTKNPSNAFKYKVMQDENIVSATVSQVEWNVSKHGFLKPTVMLHPFELQRVRITKATGFNAKFINDNKIGPGSIVRITRAGDVIPRILEVEKSTEADLPSSEEYEWNDTGVDIVLKDSKSKEVVLNQLVDFCTSMDFPNIREGSIVTLMDNGIDTCDKIVTTSMPKYISLLGVNGSKIYNGIRERVNGIELWTVMGSLPIFGRGVGKRKFKQLISQIGEDFNKWTASDIIQAEGFDEKTATKILSGISDFNEFQQKTNSIIKYSSSPTVDSSGMGPYTGHNICMTGFRDKKLSALVEQLGGKIQSGVSGKTTILVCNDVDSVSGKVQKAKDLIESGKAKIAIVSQETFTEEVYKHVE